MKINKKILIVRSSVQGFGGIENQVLLMARKYREYGVFTPELITSDETSSLALKFMDDDIKVHVVPMDLNDIYSSAKRLLKLIDFNEVAVIQSHMYRESFIGRLLKREHPKIFHAYRVHTYIDCSWVPEWKKILYHVADHITARYVDIYFANGQYLQDELIKRSQIAHNKIKVILDGTTPCGHSSEPSFYDSDEVLKPKMVMVANFVPHKGHDVLIRSLRLLQAKGMRIKVTLVGSYNTDDKLFLSLRKMARKYGVLSQLEFAGFSVDIASVLRDFPVLVLPSDREGTPNSIMEAMSMGKIVIATRTGGVPEIINDGYNGFLHEVQNDVQLADTLHKIFTLPAVLLKPVSEAAYKTWCEHFTDSTMMSQITDVYRRVAIQE